MSPSRAKPELHLKNEKNEFDKLENIITPEKLNAGLNDVVHHINLHRLVYKIDVISFIFINLLLYAINTIFTDTEYQWWPWVITGWGFILIYHSIFYLKRGFKSFLEVHIYIFIFTNLYLTFIDWYSTGSFDWIWFPLIPWTMLLVINIVIVNELNNHHFDVDLFAVLISDDSGRVLLQVQTEDENAQKKLGLTESKAELIPMFITAIQSFSNEINIQDCDDFRLQGANLRVISIKDKNLTYTGFASNKSRPGSVRSLLKQIALDFYNHNHIFIDQFAQSGNSTPFDAYASTIKNQMLLL